MKQKAYLSAGEAARALGVSVKTIQRWDKAGLLPVIRTATNQRRIPADALHSLLNPRIAQRDHRRVHPGSGKQKLGRTSHPVHWRWQNEKGGEQKGQKMMMKRETGGKEAMRYHSEKQACPRRGNAETADREDQAIANPSEVAKTSGMPNSRIVTREAVGPRALRASRA